MIDPEVLTSLASFSSPGGSAVSFYFSEPHAENLAHRGTLITAKDRIRQLLRGEQDTPALREIARRLEERAEQFRLSHPRGIAIFASAQPDYWREIELRFAVEPRAHAGASFVLSPLLPLATKEQRYFILLLDRSVTRLLVFDGDSLVERTKDFGEERIPVRETGASRKVSDERSKDDDAFHHLRHVGERVFKALEQGEADFIYIGCRTELYPEIKAAIRSNLVQKIAGQFHCDPGLITLEEVRRIVQPLIEERSRTEVTALIDEVSGAAAAASRGAVGARAVVRALEQGELQTVLIAPHGPVAVTVCTSCEHIDVGTNVGGDGSCALCGNSVLHFDDLAEVIARRAHKGSFEVRMVPENIPAPGDGFLAKLRFRAERSSAQVA